MRLFLAINLPSEIRREVSAATAMVRAAASELAWVDDERLHFTLKFLGEASEERVPELQASLAGVAGRHRELVMSLGGVGAFPNFRRARVVWLGVSQEPRLELLHHDVETSCERLGFEIEARPFRPHVTLARVKHAPGEERLRALARAAKQTDYRTDFIVRSIDLMQSTPAGGALAYTTLVSAPLRSD
ncbi:MAG: RNA 2',3'-cyclic phosphodiesterase [Gemmatimonadales bacterium]